MAAPETARGIARYRLARNPYTPRALDPLSNAEALNKAVHAADLFEAVERYVADAAAAKESEFVLVSGRSGTGRTSVANHLMRCYRDNLEHIDDPARFVVPRTRFSGQDPFDIFLQWFTSLNGKLKRAGVTPLGQQGWDFDAELASRSGLDADTYATYLLEFLPALAEVLETKGAGFAACFENVKDYGLVEAAFESFIDTPTIVVLTVLDYRRTQDSIRVLFERHRAEVSGRSAYPALDLEPIRGVNAKELVQYHWMCASPEQDSPFDEVGLERSFGDRLRTAGRVLRITEHVLNTYAATLGEGPLWPEAREQLRLRSDVLEQMVPEADKVLPDVDDD
jgi:hypothetical protein